MNPEWKAAAQRGLKEIGISAPVKHHRLNIFMAQAEIKISAASSIKQALLTHLNSQGWHVSIVVQPKRDNVRFVFYGSLNESNNSGE